VRARAGDKFLPANYGSPLRIRMEIGYVYYYII